MHLFFGQLWRSQIFRSAGIILLILTVVVANSIIFSGIGICYAAQHGDLTMVKLLLKARPGLVFSRYKEASFSEPDESGWTPLHYATAFDHKDIVELLLANKAEVNAKDKEGKSPMHLAVLYWWRDPIIAKLLLAKGADANAKDNEGRTPLYFATIGGDKDMAEFLRKHGGHE